MKHREIGINKQDSLVSWYQSLGIHIALLLFGYSSHFFWSNDIQYQPTIRVDMVDLPKKFQEKMKLLPKTKEAQTKDPKIAKKTKAQEKNIEKKKPLKKAINLKKRDAKDRAKSALDRLKAVQRLKQQSKRKKNQETAISKIAGNIKSEGVAVSAKELNNKQKIEYNSYIYEVDQHVKSHWSLPRYLDAENLSTRILVKIDSGGHVIHKRIVASSGNSNYDDIVIKAVESASPFPPPPNKFAGIFKNEGFEFGFPE